MNQTQTVSSLVSSVKNLLEGEFSHTSVIGEVSNLSRSSAGHTYFTLSDRDSGLSAVLFRGDALRNPEVKNLRDGDKIVCHGGVSVYEKRGTFQLIVRRVERAGAGDLKEQFEKLKRELAEQGLFDQAHKKQIPSFPRRVAVITAEGGAALQDFLNVYKRRAISGTLVLIPAVVQGDQSAKSLRNALAKAIKHGMNDPAKAFDVIVLTRGGGSMEDLWSFNDEGLAWDIYNCPIPVVSAVGHQVDFSISDFVADLRCETPTAAAERLTQEQTHVSGHMRRLEAQLLHFGSKTVSYFSRRLHNLSPMAQSMILRDRANLLSRRLRECRLDDRIEKITGYQEKSLQLDDVSRRFESYFNLKSKDLSFRLERNEKMLQAIDPKRVLGRGYAYVSNSKDEVMASKSNWDKQASDESFQLHFKDGTVKIGKGK